jgi:hypothetical protein
MILVYCSIPLFIAAIAIAVVPVLYGSFKQDSWAISSREFTPADRNARRETMDAKDRNVATAGASNRSFGEAGAQHVLAQAHLELETLLARLDRVRDLVAEHETAIGSLDN